MLSVRFFSAASQPELFYIADGDGQGFGDDDRQQAFPDYD